MVLSLHRPVVVGCKPIACVKTLCCSPCCQDNFSGLSPPSTWLLHLKVIKNTQLQGEEPRLASPPNQKSGIGSTASCTAGNPYGWMHHICKLYFDIDTSHHTRIGQTVEQPNSKPTQPNPGQMGHPVHGVDCNSHFIVSLDLKSVNYVTCLSIK